MQEKEVTIYDLAKIVNVAASTVSRALSGHPSINEETKKKIRALASELGYQPNRFASDLRRKRTFTIGVLVHELDTPFINSVLSGIEQGASEAMYNLVICNSAESLEREVNNAVLLFNKRVDGLIASLSSETKSLSHFDVFFNKKIPVVFFDRVERESPGIKIMVDNYRAGYQAGAHLIQMGCRNLMHIGGNQEVNVFADRWRGFKDALSKSNLPCGDDQFLICNFREEACVDVAQKIMQSKVLPDGIFIAHDLCAAICIRCFQEAGIQVPQDIAIIGFNNDITSRIVKPQLTTFHYPGYEMGSRAVEHLIDQLSFDTTSINHYTVVLKSELLIRQSSARVSPSV